MLSLNPVTFVLSVTDFNKFNVLINVMCSKLIIYLMHESQLKIINNPVKRIS